MRPPGPAGRATVVAAVALVIAACAGHGSGPGTAATSSSTSQATAPGVDGATSSPATDASTSASTAAVVPRARPITTTRPTTARPATTGVTTRTTVAAPIPPGAQVALAKVADLDSPDVLAVRDDDAAIYVGERAGRVRRLVDGQVQPDPVVDLTAETDTTGERGLLGMAFAPGSGKLYLDLTGRDGTIHILEFRLQGGNAVERRELLSIDHRQFSNHNGGALAFGPDGLLYIGVGDGGSQGDPSHHGQDLGTLLAKVLRIDPTPTATAPYTVPADNPFVGRNGARPEIWAYGLRNPWRLSFDRQTGDLWIGDVGQDAYEEIDLAGHASRGGENYGWSLREGTHAYRGGARPAASIDPVYDYSHRGGGCSVIGGYAYRGRGIPALVGSYVFGDFCTGSVQAVTMTGGRATVTDLHLQVDQLESFGQDQAGELYALSLEGPLYRIVAA